MQVNCIPVSIVTDAILVIGNELRLSVYPTAELRV